jgi:hypothetical protein
MSNDKTVPAKLAKGSEQAAALARFSPGTYNPNILPMVYRTEGDPDGAHLYGNLECIHAVMAYQAFYDAEFVEVVW